MSSVMHLVRNVVVVFACGFLTLFVLRLGYGYWDQPNGVMVSDKSQVQSLSQGLFNFAGGLKNYASRKRKTSVVIAGGRGFGAGDQKYEKVASVALKSAAFEKDAGRVRELVRKEDALIQFEQSEGLKGHRMLRLAIGVAPARFDSFVDLVKTFGKLTALTINKSDKTNEYRELTAKRVSLEKTRSALEALKKREGEIKDMVALEKQILELEQSIQALGVSLGDFDAENEFVTVKVLLRETRSAVARSISFVHRAFVAFVWAAKYYALLWIGFACALVSAFVAVYLVRLAIKLLSVVEGKTQT